MNRLIEKMVLGIRHGLALRHLADRPLSRLRECHHRRREPSALRIRNDSRFAAFHHSHDRVGGSQIDSDDFAHMRSTSAFAPLQRRTLGLYHYKI
jgi:hypothetical protein